MAEEEDTEVEEEDMVEEVEDMVEEEEGTAADRAVSAAAEIAVRCLSYTNNLSRSRADLISTYSERPRSRSSPAELGPCHPHQVREELLRVSSSALADHS